MVTVGEKLSVYAETFRTASTLSQRDLARTSLLPGLVITFAASYAAMLTDCRKNTAFAISMEPNTREINKGIETAISVAAVPKRERLLVASELALTIVPEC